MAGRRQPTAQRATAPTITFQPNILRRRPPRVYDVDAPRSSTIEMIREILLILFVTCSTLGSQLLVKRAVGDFAARGLEVGRPEWFIAVATSVPVLAAVAIQGVGFLVWVMVVSRLKLGVAFGISGAFFYVLMAAASWYFYGEKLVPQQWLGLVLISSGVLLVTVAGRGSA